LAKKTKMNINQYKTTNCEILSCLQDEKTKPNEPNNQSSLITNQLRGKSNCKTPIRLGELPFFCFSSLTRWQVMPIKTTVFRQNIWL
jgi:hypothetical protein